jgi:hypothetical protein
MKKVKRYLGDSVYADCDNGYLILTTEDGIRATNTILLEAEVLGALQDYIEDLRSARKVEKEMARYKQ